MFETNFSFTTTFGGYKKYGGTLPPNARCYGPVANFWPGYGLPNVWAGYVNDYIDILLLLWFC